MKLIVGLGNPGPKYETTRHNVGFLAVDRLVDKFAARGPQTKNEAEFYEATIGGEKALLVKPMTYMNLSGKSVGPFFKFYKCHPEDLIVLQDEIDLKTMQLRVKTGGGSGGHNGIKSIDQHVGSDHTGYHRIRIGVGKPQVGSQRDAADHVLDNFLDVELNELDKLLDEVCECVEFLVQGKSKEAMNRFNQKRDFVLEQSE